MNASLARTAKIAQLTLAIDDLKSQIDALAAGQFVPYLAEVRHGWGHTCERIEVQTEAEDSVVSLFKLYMEVRYASRAEALRRLCGRSGTFRQAVKALCDAKNYPATRATFKARVEAWAASVGANMAEVKAQLSRI